MPASGAQAATVRMLLVNDVYVIDTLRDGSGGLARVAGLRDSIERVTGDRVLFVLAGDVLSPSVLGKWYLGAHMVDAFNAARLDYATLGNHEFDISRAALGARLGESHFRWLSGNCAEATGAPFPGVRGWDTVRVNGVKVGLYGTTVVRDYPSFVKCQNADTATTRLVDTLTAQRSDLVVGLTHRYIFEDTHTLEVEPRVQAILGGHEHDGKRAVVNGRVVVKAMSNARTAVLVTFTRGPNGWVTRDEVIPMDRRLPLQAATRAVVARWRDTLTRRIGPDRVLGVAPEPINAIDSISRKGESRFGDLVVDGMRLGTHADVALINSGALRFDDVMAAGPITRHMIEGIFLFADETRAVTFPLTGARLRAVLEMGVRQGGLGDGPYPQVSGVRFAVDGSRPSGSRIVGDLTQDDGRVIAPTDTLRVTFVTYPACRGGDGYAIPEATAACAAAVTSAQSSARNGNGKGSAREKATTPPIEGRPPSRATATYHVRARN
jgi:5'-nucleotidase